MPKRIGELAESLGVGVDAIGKLLAELGIETTEPDVELEDTVVDKIRLELVTKGIGKVSRRSSLRRSARRSPEAAAESPTAAPSDKPKSTARRRRATTTQKSDEDKLHADQPSTEEAQAKAPPKRKRVSSKKLLEALESGEVPAEGTTAKRLGKAVRVPKAPQADRVEKDDAKEPAPEAETSPRKERITKQRSKTRPPAAPEPRRPGAAEVLPDKEEAPAAGDQSPPSESAPTKMATLPGTKGAGLIEVGTRKPPAQEQKVVGEPEQRVEAADSLGQDIAPSEVLEAPEDLERVLEEVELEGVEEAPAQLPGEPVPHAPKKKKSKRTPEEEYVRQVRRRTEPTVPAVATVQVRRGITAGDFAAAIGVSPSEVVQKLVQLGQMKSVTMSLTDEELELLGESFGVEVKVQSPDVLRAQEEAARREQELKEDEGKLEPRPPVVTVMGHVDHGKTLLLDRIRKTNVVEKEFGGITQHIGAYRVERGGRSITFIDTPGHEAFTAMRARGASVTDIAVLVVAADDGVMPQTVEAVSHIRAAGVPMVVAINKIDKEEADPLKVKTQLTEHGVVVEELGGDVPCAEVSAMTGQGISELLDLILLVADLEDLKANPHAPASGVCIEAHLDPGKGPVATVLVKRGTLRRGDAFVAGLTYGKVRAMLDENGLALREATPSTPVQVVGFSGVAEAGDDFRVVTDDREARRIAEERQLAHRQAEAVAPRVIRLEDIHERLAAQERARLGVIIKADTQGSLEALRDALRKLERPEVQLDIVHGAVGGISENDVMLAQASEAVIIGFNVRPDVKARTAAARAGVDIRTYEIIYKVVEDIEAAMVGLLRPETEEVVTGTAEVRATFRIPRVGVVAGCYVVDGVVSRGSDVRLLREGVVVYTGKIASLKRFKDDVRQVQAGYECGIGLEGYQDIKEGDVLETYEVREVVPS